MKKLSYIAIMSFASTVALASCGKSKIEVEMPSYTSEYTPIMEDSLPIISITSNSGSNDFITMPQAIKSMPNYCEPWYEKCTITVKDGTGKETLSSVPGDVKVRGNWTTTYSKKPLRIKFEEKQQMLGLNNDAKEKSWVLLASYKVPKQYI